MFISWFKSDINNDSDLIKKIKINKNFYKKINLNEHFNRLKRKLYDLFYPNGVLKYKYLPKVLVSQKVEVVYKTFNVCNEYGYLLEVSLEGVSYLLYVLNSKVTNYSKNLVSVSIFQNWGKESNKY